MSQNQTNVLSTEKEWRTYFSDRGVQPDLVDLYCKYAARLLNNGVPVIFEFEHLCTLLGRTVEFLSAAVNSPESFYRTFFVKKRSGGSRKISAPYPSLLECQRWILDNILSVIPGSEVSFAFKTGKSIINNAIPHLAKRELLRIDIADFFGSITIRQVISIFRKLGYSQRVSVYLGRLCCLHDVLPQGAPTSPMLSELVFLRADRALITLARRNKLVFTRYADDLCFSGEDVSPNLVRQVEYILEKHGFHINESKTFLAKRAGQRHFVTGLDVTSDSPRVPRSFRRDLRKDIHFIDKFGLLSHSGYKKLRDSKYLDRLRGKINFWLSIEPDSQFALHAKQVIARVEGELSGR